MAPPVAADGIVRTVAEMHLPEIVREGDLIICRTNAPLIERAFTLLKHGIPAVISGKDMSTNLLSLARRVKATRRPYQLPFFAKVKVTQRKGARCISFTPETYEVCSGHARLM